MPSQEILWHNPHELNDRDRSSEVQKPRTLNELGNLRRIMGLIWSVSTAVAIALWSPTSASARESSQQVTTEESTHASAIADILADNPELLPLFALLGIGGIWVAHSSFQRARFRRKLHKAYSGWEDSEIPPDEAEFPTHDTPPLYIDSLIPHWPLTQKSINTILRAAQVLHDIGENLHAINILIEWISRSPTSAVLYIELLKSLDLV
jgi:hypothetical protein